MLFDQKTLFTHTDISIKALIISSVPIDMSLFYCEEVASHNCNCTRDIQKISSDSLVKQGKTMNLFPKFIHNSLSANHLLLFNMVTFIIQAVLIA